MDLEEFINRIERLPAAIDEANQRNFLIAGFDAVDAIKDRLQEEGLSEDLNSFDDYTPNYDKYKTRIGRNKGFRDFTLSGDMMRNVKARLQPTSDGYEVLVGPDAPAMRTRMEHNQNVVGRKLMALSDQESSDIIDGVRQRYIQDVRNLLGL